MFLPQRRREQPPDGVRGGRQRGRTPRLSHDRPRVQERGADRDAAAGRMRERRRGAARRSPPNCAINARMEILDGRGESPVVDVDRAEQHREPAEQAARSTWRRPTPAEGWSTVPRRQRREPAEVVGDRDRRRVARRRPGRPDRDAAPGAPRGVVPGWTDAKHGWVTLGATPSSRYFSLIHARDNFFERTCYAYLAFGLTPSCPLPGFTVPPAESTANPLLVDNRQPPFGTRLLVFNLEPSTTPPASPTRYHPSTTRDGWIAARGRRHAVAEAAQRLALDPR